MFPFLSNWSIYVLFLGIQLYMSHTYALSVIILSELLTLARCCVNHYFGSISSFFILALVFRNENKNLKIDSTLRINNKDVKFPNLRYWTDNCQHVNLIIIVQYKPWFAKQNYFPIVNRQFACHITSHIFRSTLLTGRQYGSDCIL